VVDRWTCVSTNLASRTQCRALLRPFTPSSCGNPVELRPLIAVVDRENLARILPKIVDDDNQCRSHVYQYDVIGDSRALLKR